MSINSLLNQIKNEEIVLPAIQRDFVWSEDSTERLLDSIMRGYPVGIVLLWETYEDIQYRSFVRDFREGDSHTYRDNPTRKRLKLVLDGQQRLQSLYVALYGTREGKELSFDVLSGLESDDVSDEKFHFAFLTPSEAQKAHQSSSGIPGELKRPRCYKRVGELFSLNPRDRVRLINQLVEDLSLSEDDKVRVELNLATFAAAFSTDDNVLKAATIDEDLAPTSASRKSEADVLEIFVRINREGTPLSRSDLIFSMIKLNWRESAEALPEFIKSINTGNSFDLDMDFVIRCLFAVSDLGTKLDLNLLRKKTNVDKLRSNFDKCCAAIRATVDFLQTDCRCQSSPLLGGQNTLIPFVYYLFHTFNHEVPNPQVGAIRKSLFVLGFAKPFSRWGESRLSSYIRSELQPRAVKHDLAFPFAETVRLVKYWERIGSVSDLLEANSLLALHVIQGLSGAKVQYERNAPQVDHIFPRSILRERGFDESLVNDVANFWILAKGKNQNKSNRPPAKYFSDVDEKLLQEALIDRDMLDYRRYKAFLAERLERMVASVNKKIGWSEQDFA